MRARDLALAAAAAALLLAPREASAYCRATTVSAPTTFVPTTEQPCWTDGLAVYWKNACIGYELNEAASKQVSLDDAEGAMAAAFAQWTNAACTGGKPSLDVRFVGTTAARRSKADHANVIMFDDDEWPHSNPHSTVALTTITYVPETGELVDADMEINSANMKLTVNGPIPSDGYDLASVLTHEAGHMLGLAHSMNPNATMYADYATGSTSMSSLAADDVHGICAIYEPDGTRTTADGGVPEGPCDPNANADTLVGGCACRAAPSRSRGEGPWLLALAAAAALRRRHSKSKRATA